LHRRYVTAPAKSRKVAFTGGVPTFLSDSGYLTYIITARRTTSGELLK